MILLLQLRDNHSTSPRIFRSRGFIDCKIRFFRIVGEQLILGYPNLCFNRKFIEFQSCLVHLADCRFYFIFIECFSIFYKSLLGFKMVIGDVNKTIIDWHVTVTWVMSWPMIHSLFILSKSIQMSQIILSKDFKIRNSQFPSAKGYIDVDTFEVMVIDLVILVTQHN